MSVKTPKCGKRHGRRERMVKKDLADEEQMMGREWSTEQIRSKHSDGVAKGEDGEEGWEKLGQ